LPIDDPELRTTAWKNLRAFSGFVPRILPTCRLAPELVGPHVLSALSIGDTGYCLFVDARQRFDFQVPAARPNSDAVAVWYNPTTDQNIILPQVPWAGNLTIVPPSKAPWIYCGLSVPQLNDSATTTIAITPEPPEPDWEALDSLTSDSERRSRNP
jgi:hypothetical protein